MNGQTDAGQASYNQMTSIGNASTNQMNQLGVPGAIIGATGYNLYSAPFSSTSTFEIQSRAINQQLQHMTGVEYANYQRQAYNYELLGLGMTPVLGAIGGSMAGGWGAAAGYAAGIGLSMALPSMAAEFGFIDLPESVTIEEQTKALMSEAIYGAAWSQMDPFTTRGLRGTSVLQAQNAAEDLYGSMRSMGFQGAELSRLMPALQSIGAFEGTDNIDEMIGVAEQYIGSIRDFISRTNAMMEEVVALIGVGGQFGLEGQGIESYLQSISRGSGAANLAPADFTEMAARSGAGLVGYGTDITGIFDEYGLASAYTHGAAGISGADIWRAPFTHQAMAQNITKFGIGRFTGTASGMQQAVAMSVSPGALDEYIGTGYVSSDAYNDFWDLSPTQRYQAKYDVGEFLANNASNLYLGDVSRIMNSSPGFGGNLDAAGAYLSENLNLQYGMQLTPVQGREMLETYDFQRSLSGQAQTWEYMTLIAPYEERHEAALSEMTERIYRGMVGTTYITSQREGWEGGNPWFYGDSGLQGGSRQLTDDELLDLDVNLVGISYGESISYMLGRNANMAVDVTGLLGAVSSPEEQRLLARVINETPLYRKDDNGDAVEIEGIKYEERDGIWDYYITDDTEETRDLLGIGSQEIKNDRVGQYIYGSGASRFSFNATELNDTLNAITVGSYMADESFNYSNRYGVSGTLDEYRVLNFDPTDFIRVGSGATGILDDLLLAQATLSHIGDTEFDFTWTDLRGQGTLEIAKEISRRKFGTSNFSSLDETDRAWVASFVSQKYNINFDADAALAAYNDSWNERDVYVGFSDSQISRFSALNLTDRKAMWDYYHGRRDNLPSHLIGVASAMGLTSSSGRQLTEADALYQYRTALTEAEALVQNVVSGSFNIEDVLTNGIEGTALENYTGDNEEIQSLISLVGDGLQASERAEFIRKFGAIPTLSATGDSGVASLTERQVAEGTMNNTARIVELLELQNNIMSPSHDWRGDSVGSTAE